MTERRDLLPANATTIERAISRAIGPWTPGAQLLSTLGDAQRIPAPLLPILAASEDIPPVWPQAEAEQRALIAASPRLHAMIGTASGLRTLARMAGAEVVRLEMPPAKTFLGYWDAESRRQWLAAHPEMRIHTQRERAPAEGLMIGSAYLRHEPPCRTSAMARSALRAEIVWPDGRVQPLRSHGWTTLQTEATGTVDLAQRAVAVGVVIGQPLHGPLARADASARLWRVARVSYRERVDLLTLRQMAPSLSPLRPDAEAVAERAVRMHASCLGAPVTHTVMGDASARLYTRIRLHDPAVAARPKQGPTYLGFTRLTSPPFVALAAVRMPARTLPSALAGSAMGTSLAAGDARARIAPVLDAMDWARATHDKILIRSRLHATARATRIHKAGAVLAGQTIAVT